MILRARFAYLSARARVGVRAKRGSSDHGVKVRVGVRVKGNVGVVRVVLVVMMVRRWRVNG